MLLKLKAKVNLFQSEEQMEANETYDLGNIASSKEWVWRHIAIPVETVKRVVAFNSAKTIVYTDEGEQILVAEVFDDVYVRWRETLYEYYKVVEVKEPDIEDISKEKDEDEE